MSRHQSRRPLPRVLREVRRGMEDLQAPVGSRDCPAQRVSDRVVIERNLQEGMGSEGLTAGGRDGTMRLPTEATAAESIVTNGRCSGPYVALFLPTLHGGGAERQLVNLAARFQDLGLRVDLVAAKAEGAYRSHVQAGVRLVDLKARRTLSAIQGLARYLRRENPEALLSVLGHANLAALWAKRLAGVSTRVVVCEPGMVSHAVRSAPNRREWLIPVFERLFFPWADEIVAVSRSAADDLSRAVRLPRRRIRVIYNPVVSSELIEQAKAPLDHAWFRPGSPPVVLGVGRLTPAKDFATLIRAFAIVHQERAARLLILGEGELRAGLEALVAELDLCEEVSLPGFANNPYAVMARAGVFVLSSAWEGFGTALVEAMACGLPVVSTDCGGPSEILEGGRMGRLVPVGDPEALAGAILATLTEPSDVGLLRARAQDFSLERIADQYLELLCPRR
jgi:glycosyltransferase involved in cell wall biosynthesis